jgi:hypothetical protein
MPTVRNGFRQHPPLARLAAPVVPLVDGMPDEQSVVPPESVPPPPAAAALDDPVVEPPAEACGDGRPEPPACGGGASVWVGTARGSVPHDEDVVTPPVALSETEHGMPCSLKAGSV